MRKKCKCLEKLCNNIVSQKGRRCNSCSAKLKWVNHLFDGKNHPAFKGGKIKINCSFCNKEFDVFPYTLKQNAEFNYCSRKCQGKHFKMIRKGDKAGNWKGGKIKVNCVVCETEKFVTKNVFNKYNHFYCSNKCKAIWTKNNRSGINHYNWQGGITDLSIIIRNSIFGINWRKEVFKRSNYTCQECEQCGGSLNADHIKPFNIIFSEFLSYYSQFSPIEDKETLVRLSENWAEFWNINNGQALCEDCHKLKTKSDWKLIIEKRDKLK